MIKRLISVWKKREFILSLIKANLKLRYRASFLGYLWTLINPLLILVVFTIIFTKILSAMPIKKFPVFMMAGYLPWNFTIAAIINSTYSLTSNKNFINLIELPKELFPIAEVCSQAISFILTLPILLIGLLYFRVSITPYILYIPFIFFIQFVLTLGISIFVSFMYIFFRDLKHMLEVGLTILFYITPIFYPLSIVPEKYRIIYYLNPFSSIVTSYQNVIIFGKNPELFDILYPAILGVVILILAYGYFIKMEDSFAEKI